jgi:hypothetical protein
MRLMTVGTCRYGPWLLFPEFALDDLDVHFFDPGMAFGACVGDIASGDCRPRICMWEDEMISMTVVTSGCDDKALFEQALSVDALRVIGQDVVFGNVVDPCNRRSFPVAFAAEHRDVHFIGAGSHIGGGQNIVFSMTFAAGWSVWCTSF